MTARHLVTDGDLSLLCDIYTNDLVYACGKVIVSLLVGEHLNVNYDTRLTVRQTEGGISYLSCLLTEDSTEKSFLSGKLCFTLGCNLTDKDVT